MDEMLALAKTQQSCASLPLSLPSTKKGSRENQFYINLLNEKYKTDLEAAKDLYGTTPTDTRYKMLKLRLKKKLYNKLFFLDYETLNLKDFVENEQDCIVQLHHANLFLRQGLYHICEGLAKKVVQVSRMYDFLNLELTALEMLLTCKVATGKLKEYNKIKLEFDVALCRRNNEVKALTMFHVIKLQLNKSVKSRKNFITKFEQDLDKLYTLWKETHSYETYNAYYKSFIWYNELVGHFSNIVDLTIGSEKLLRKSEVNPLRFDSLYNKYILVYAHLRSGKYSEGLKYCNEYISNFNERSSNWFAFMENYVLLALHSKNYELAHNLFERVNQNTYFENISLNAKERWRLFKAYSSFLYNTVNHRDQTINPFMLSLPAYSKDKQGFNVAILILQFLYFLQKEETEALLYRIESLKKYILTHLKDSFSLRSKILLKLLILTVTQDFDMKSCSVKGKKLYQRLLDTPTPGDAYAEIEIVPYEHLWELILLIIEKQYK